MVAGLDDAAVVEHGDLIGVVDGGQAVRDGDGGAAAGQGVERLLDGPLGSVSRALVASSSTSTRGSRSSVRAMAMRCFSPPENRCPRDPTTVS